MIKNTLCYIIICLFFAPPGVSALPLNESNSAAKTSAADKQHTNFFPINNRITHALSSLNVPSKKPISFDLKRADYNAAEKYLILVIQATELTSQNKITASITKLQQAKQLEGLIKPKQLMQSDFSQLYLLLASNYVQQQNFEAAYIEHKHYFKKYNANIKSVNEKIIHELADKHQINKKQSQNELLKHQNQLKKLSLIEEQQLKKNQQRNFALIVCTILLFTIFFTRQIKQKEKLIKQAKTDTVTGFLNRKSLFSIGAKLVSRFIKDDSELSLLILKVAPDNKFKHADNILNNFLFSQVALMMSEATRSRDMLFRLANEEFVVLLPHSNIFKAKAVAERINEKILSLRFNKNLLNSSSKEQVDKPTVDLSIGISSLTPSDISFEGLLHKADLAMYQAKEQGDNCVLTYESIASHFERRGG